MEVWLFYVIIGLGLDIAGIWIIASPLLRIVYKDKSVWQKQYEKIKLEYKIALKEHEEGKYSIPENTRDELPFKRLQDFVFDVFNNISLEKQDQRELAILGLIIITLGFLSQIGGSMIKP